ncbi:MAG: hypothetical protein H7641_02355 [Candidatus Heimdallarchaeota archaeon]|nr:hypothetical protein [Candidatus Heimdallarchaeota archaeon]MCK4876406.1 hypothetical protein [Candidatus Heimdallarchaeota archaeon]
MLRSLKWKVFALLLIYSLLIVFFQVSAEEEEYLIVRIVDAEYPPRVYIREERNYTGYTFTVVYQIENPTSLPITIPYVCGPYPFPYLRTNLRDKSLRVFLGFIIEWVAGETIIQPGFREDSYKFGFEIENYFNESLPLGNYKMWFDFTNCSFSPVPVVTEKMYIDVTETSVTYYFDYNNETRIVYPRQIINGANFFFISTILSLVLINRVIRKNNGISKFD